MGDSVIFSLLVFVLIGVFAAFIGADATLTFLAIRKGVGSEANPLAKYIGVKGLQVIALLSVIGWEAVYYYHCEGWQVIPIFLFIVILIRVKVVLNNWQICVDGLTEKK
jgi:hypothetical protein